MPTPDTSSTHAARDHARSMHGTVARTMPTMPPSDAADLPDEIDPSTVLWDETVAGGGYTSLVVPRGAQVRLVDLDGDACAGVLAHRADQTSERLCIADTVKVQWQAYLEVSMVLLSDMGRVLLSVVDDSCGCHDTFCGTTNRAANEARYGDGAIDGPSPNGRDLFALALAKRGMDRRDVAPNINLFAGTRVDADGSLRLLPPTPPGATVTLRAEMATILTVVNVPHPLDERPDYTVTPLQITAWSGPATTADDLVRTASPEAERAFLNTEATVGVTT